MKTKPTLPHPPVQRQTNSYTSTQSHPRSDSDCHWRPHTKVQSPPATHARAMHGAEPPWVDHGLPVWFAPMRKRWRNKHQDSEIR